MHDASCAASSPSVHVRDADRSCAATVASSPTAGATTFAICLACVKRGGSSLAPAYRSLLLWLAGITLALVAAAGLVAWLRR